MKNKNLNWWTGVVEDRDDPEKLGRCRVRIFGYHTSDTRELPTKDLPWAIPIQPITSAATSGVGATPVGVVTGTWVVGWFLDGEEAQRPIIMGTLAGKPSTNAETKAKQTQESTNTNTLKDSRNNIVYDIQGNAINTDTVQLDVTETLIPLKSQDLTKLTKALGDTLSAGVYTKVGNSGELGKYQLSLSTLIDLGYLQRPPGGIITSDIADTNSNWTNKGGIKSKSDFLASTGVQETAMFDYTKSNYDTLVRLGKVKETDNYQVVGGLLASAHVMGAKNSDKLDKKTNAGTKARDFFIVGNSILGGDSTEFLRTYEEAGNYLPNTSTLNNEDLTKVKGFEDPNKKYPKFEYAGLSDVNKLAVGDRSHLSFQVKENNKIENIQLAKTSQTWDEPEPAFGGNYPYNQVIETEAGHVIEIDNTPNAERIQVFHKKGTYIEIDVNGSMVRKTVGENYEIMDRNNFVYVKGAHCLTVEGKTSILVKDNAVIEVEGDLSVTGHGDTLVQSAGTMAVVAETAIVTAKNGLDIASEGAINIQGKSISMRSSSGAINIKSSADLNLQSSATGALSLKGGLTILIDAAIVKTKMGANIIKAIALSVLTPPTKKTPNTTQIPVLQRKDFNDESFLFDSGEPQAAAYNAQREAAGEISNDIQLTPKASDLAITRSIGVASSSKISQADCEICYKFNNSFPRSFKLSKLFTLGSLIPGNLGPPLQAQRGLQEQDIVCNLMQLAENVLEPINAKYPGMIVSSGFRSENAINPKTGKIVGPNNSDHGIGAAADLQWPNRQKSDLKDIAEWIVANVPHRQVLLEYTTNAGTDKIKSAWIHVAFLSDNGKLVRSTKAPVQTFVNNQSRYTKLVNLA
jgi:uncharacterized protein YcbK (DUF882 family)